MVRVLAYETEGPGFNSRPCLKLLKCKIELCIRNNNNNNNNNSHHLLGSAKNTVSNLAHNYC